MTTPGTLRDFWNASAAALDAAAPIEAFATVTPDADAVRYRDALEKAHLETLLGDRLRGRVLDLGGGAGRFALWLAPRVEEVVLVDYSESLLAVARARAEAMGLRNVRTVARSILELEPDGQFDVVLVMGVAAHLENSELHRLVDVCAAAVDPSGCVVLKEPVTTDGSTRLDSRVDRGGHPYKAWFRPRGVYADVFRARFEERYRAPTCAHPIPFFLGGTESALDAASRPTARAVVERLAPVWVRVDPALRAFEERMRRTPVLRSLLADVPVVQDFHLFEPAPRASRAGAADERLSAVVIAFNEEECLEAVVGELARALDLAGVPFELVLVNDGSTDGTEAVMRRISVADPRARVVSYPDNRGIGGALRAGFDAARGEFVTWVPADGQIAPSTVVDLYRRRHDAAIVTTVYRTRDDALYRHMISASLNLLIRMRSGEPAKSGGNYVFARSIWERFGPRDDDSMMISTELRRRVREAGLPIVEMPIDARRRVGGHSKVLNPRTIGRTLLAALGGPKSPRS